MSLGDRIKEKRKEKKLTQQQLAKILGGIDNSTISKWESDIYEPDTSSLDKLAKVFGVSVDYLVSGRVKNVEDEIEMDPEIRSLARDWNKILPTDRELLKGIIKQMSERGKKAKDE